MKFSTALRLAALAAWGCLVLLLLLPHEAERGIVLGYSMARLLMLGALLLVALLLSLAVFLEMRHPQDEQRFETALGRRLQTGNLRIVVYDAAALVFLVGVYFCGLVILTSDVYLKQILLRLLPFVLFGMALAGLVMSLDLLRQERPWRLTAIALAVGVVAAAWLLQTVLLASLTHPYRRMPELALAVLLVTGVLAFFYFRYMAGLQPAQRRLWGWFLGLVCVLFLVQWVVLPAKYWRSLPLLALLAPLVIFLAAWIVMLCFWAWDRLSPVHRKLVQRALWIAAAVGVLGLGFLYWQAATTHSRILNYQPTFTDQGEYLKFIKDAVASHFTTIGDANRMPLYPYFQALFVRPGMSDAQIFWMGKQVNIILSLVLLVILGLVFYKYLGAAQALLLALIVAFSLYLFKAPYLQAEILFYFLAFIGFLMMLHMLNRPGWILAAAAGIVLGLAHLTKASILLGVLIFVGVYLLKEGFNFRNARRSQAWNSDQRNGALRRLGYLVVLLVCFAAVIYPYSRAMKQQFGSYLYNVNLNVYVWYDDLNQALDAEDLYHFTQRPPSDLPADIRPGPLNYLRQHTPAQILERLRFGVSEQLRNIFDPFSVTAFHLALLAILAVVVLADFKNSLATVRKYPYLAGFSVLFFVAYLAVFVWYAPVSPERRFTYTLYIPLLFSIFVSLKELVANSGLGELRRLRDASLLLVSLVLLVNFWLVLTERIYFDRFGS